VLAALIIVFREIVEAGLIVGIVLAAARGVPGRLRLVAGGIAAGAAGAGLLAGFAGQVANLFEGAGQEVFNAGILLAAVLMLAWHNIWMASHGRQMAQSVKALGRSVSAGERAPLALAIVVAVAVLREGSEAVLFLYGVLAAGGATSGGVVAGAALGLAAGAAVAALMYFGLLAIPSGRLFQVTGWLITLLAAGMAAQAVAFLQQGGFADLWQTPLWDTSATLSDGSILGRIAHTLIGYTDQPNALQLAAWAATILAITVLARAVGGHQPPRPARASA
jgi:high-affinity iron transporter